MSFLERLQKEMTAVDLKNPKHHPKENNELAGEVVGVLSEKNQRLFIVCESMRGNDRKVALVIFWYEVRCEFNLFDRSVAISQGWKVIANSTSSLARSLCPVGP